MLQLLIFLKCSLGTTEVQYCMYYAMTQEDLTISSQGKFPPVLSIQVGDIANQSQFLKKWGRGEAENKIGHSIPPPNKQ